MKTAGEIIKNLLSGIKIPNFEKTLTKEWENMVGKDLAEHIKIKDISKTVLYLEADHPGWMQILNMKKRGILEKIKREFPEKKIEDFKISLKKRHKNNS